MGSSKRDLVFSSVLFSFFLVFLRKKHKVFVEKPSVLISRDNLYFLLFWTKTEGFSKRIMGLKTFCFKRKLKVFPKVSLVFPSYFLMSAHFGVLIQRLVHPTVSVLLTTSTYILVPAIFSPTSVSRDQESRLFFDETSRDHATRIFFFLSLLFFLNSNSKIALHLKNSFLWRTYLDKQMIIGSQ